MSDQFDVFIGLEIHIQLLTNSKMFCACPVQFGKDPNTNVCPTCLGYPGTIPAPNMKAIEYAYAIANALHCTLAETVQFERKNYFYPDLPKNYQISQFYNPVGRNGHFALSFNNEIKTISIGEAHLEEDAGKLVHTSDMSLCDYNRAGTPLMEVVTQPDITSAVEAEHLLKQFRRLVRYLGVCDGNMEQGSLRCDANVSVNHKGAGLGKKVEIKNLNSFRFVRMAIEYEIDRHISLLQASTPIIQETRLWNENQDSTESMRTKEQEDDYRYFTDPDIIPWHVPTDFFDEINESSVELPVHRTARMKTAYQLSDDALNFFTEEKYIADFFEETIQLGASPQLVVTWGMGDMQKLLNRYKLKIGQPPLTAIRFANILVYLQNGILHGKLAKQVLEKVFTDDDDPAKIIEKYQLKALDSESLKTVIHTVLVEYPDAACQYKSGDSKPFGFLVGKIMTATNGRAEPQLLQQELTAQLQDF